VAISICDFELWPDARQDQQHLPRIPMLSRWNMAERASKNHGLLQVHYAFLELPRMPDRRPLEPGADRVIFAASGDRRAAAVAALAWPVPETGWPRVCAGLVAAAEGWHAGGTENGMEKRTIDQLGAALIAVSKDLAPRVEELAQKSTAGALTPEELREYAEIVRLNDTLSLLKLQAEDFWTMRAAS
jgi:hypothetical protein